MSTSESQQIIESRDDVCAAVRPVLKEITRIFQMVDFERHNRIAKLRSRHYVNYYVLCHANLLRSAGWLLCHYAKNGGCQL